MKSNNSVGFWQTFAVLGAGVLVSLPAHTVVAATPTVTSTDDTRLRSSSAPAGWTNYSGSCDTSNADRWGWNNAAWVGAAPYNSPNGHQYFISCGSWFDSEAAGTTINGLTAGEQYQVTFYVAGFQEPGQYGAAVGDSYSVSVGNDTSGIQTHFSLASDAVSPLVLDADNDGIDDVAEANLGTDPNNPDSDGDGLDDGAEVNEHNTDPTKADTDADGLSDGEEISTTGTDPTNNDSDDDTLSDGDEVNTHSSDPNSVDTDSDGLTDGEEVTTLSTDPTKVDTDGDGLRDGAEVNTHSTDPLKTDTDNDALSDGGRYGSGQP